MENLLQSEYEDSKVIQSVCFKLPVEEYGVNLKQVQQITQVPQIPGFVLRKVNVRENIVPYFDMRKNLVFLVKNLI